MGMRGEGIEIDRWKRRGGFGSKCIGFWRRVGDVGKVSGGLVVIGGLVGFLILCQPSSPQEVFAAVDEWN